MTRARTLVAALLLLGGLRPALGHIPKNKIEIGVIADNFDPTGLRNERAAVVAASMAADDFGTYAGPIDVEVHPTDRNAGPGEALAQVKDWLAHEDISVVVDVTASPDDGAIATLMHQHKRLFITAGLDGAPGAALCTDATVKWGSDPDIIARSLALGLAGQNRHHAFVIAEATPLGAALAGALATVLPQQGVAIAGQVSMPFGAHAIAGTLADAERSKADTVLLALQGPALRDALQLARQLGLPDRVMLVAPAATLADIQDVGLTVAHDVIVPSAFYWDRDKGTREFAGAFAARFRQRWPDAPEAAVYSGVLATLQAARATQSIDAATIMNALRRTPPKPDLLGPVAVVGDGRVAQPIGVYRVKRPAESRGRWDDYAQLATVPAAQAYAGACGATGRGK